jgi:two-component system response regulator TtrR
MKTLAHVFYADGHKTSSHMVQAVLRQLGVAVTHFGNAADCLDSLKERACHLLISNSKRPAVEGLQLLRDVRHFRPSVPVVMLVNPGDIRVAVCAMKNGAIDCLERPPERKRLIVAIDSILQASFRKSPPLKNRLTRTEERVLQLILRGHTTSETAGKLHRSRRTVEVHRSQIMRKLQVDGMVDLVKRCAQLGLLRDWP